MAFGTFDLFHAGHENYLKQAKALGAELIVIIARDETVKKIKGHEATQNENERMKNVKNSGIPDKVVLGYKDDKYKVLKKFRPDVIALGYDQFVFTQRLEKTLIDMKLNASIVRLEPYFAEIYKSSLIKKGLEQNSNQPTNISIHETNAIACHAANQPTLRNGRGRIKREQWIKAIFPTESTMLSGLAARKHCACATITSAPSICC